MGWASYIPWGGGVQGYKLANAVLYKNRNIIIIYKVGLPVCTLAPQSPFFDSMFFFWPKKMVVDARLVRRRKNNIINNSMGWASYIPWGERLGKWQMANGIYLNKKYLKYNLLTLPFAICQDANFFFLFFDCFIFIFVQKNGRRLPVGEKA